MREGGECWCILRTTGARTLPLARSLAESGIETWTPTQTMSRRRSRSNARIERDVPIAPTFVFARARHLPELATIHALPISRHPGFSIFRYAGRVPLIPDTAIGGLRAAEDRAKAGIRKAKATRGTFAVGQEVRIPNGPFAGMTGVIEEDGKYALVLFGRKTLKIGSWLLEGNDVRAGLALAG